MNDELALTPRVRSLPETYGVQTPTVDVTPIDQLNAAYHRLDLQQWHTSEEILRLEAKAEHMLRICQAIATETQRDLRERAAHIQIYNQSIAIHTPMKAPSPSGRKLAAYTPVTGPLTRSSNQFCAGFATLL